MYEIDDHFYKAFSPSLMIFTDYFPNLKINLIYYVNDKLAKSICYFNKL